MNKTNAACWDCGEALRSYFDHYCDDCGGLECLRCGNGHKHEDYAVLHLATPEVLCPHHAGEEILKLEAFHGKKHQACAGCHSILDDDCFDPRYINVCYSCTIFGDDLNCVSCQRPYQIMVEIDYCNTSEELCYSCIDEKRLDQGGTKDDRCIHCKIEYNRRSVSMFMRKSNQFTNACITCINAISRGECPIHGDFLQPDKDGLQTEPCWCPKCKDYYFI